MTGRRNFLLTAGGAALGAPLSSASATRPNIVLVVADDMGYSDLGCYGSEIATPHIDSLARRGLRFTQFYNNARCCPTRASLLTGLYAHQTGIGHMVDDYQRPAYRGDLNNRCVTIAEALRTSGYRTAISGKWHVTPVNKSKHNWPLQRGFEKFYGIIHGGASFFDPVTLAEGNEDRKVSDPDYYFTDALTDKALGYIDEFAPGPNPFFLYLPFTSPHYPLHAKEVDVQKYKGRYDAGWDALRAERHKRMIQLGIVDRRWPLAPRESRVPSWTEAPHKEWQARRMEVYAGMIDNLDQNIGRVLRKLRELRIEDNTLVLFLSDNGGEAQELRQSPGPRPIHVPEKTLAGLPVKEGNDPKYFPGAADTFQSVGSYWANASNTPFRLYKRWAHEGGIATPLIAQWPSRIRKVNQITQQPGHVIDIMATCLDVACAHYPSTFRENRIIPLEGRSLLPVLDGKRRVGHNAICWEHEGNCAVRAGRWKLVLTAPGQWELYDLEADRTELNDLSAKHSDKTLELSGVYAAWAKRVGVEPFGSLPR